MTVLKEEKIKKMVSRILQAADPATAEYVVKVLAEELSGYSEAQIILSQILSGIQTEREDIKNRLWNSASTKR